MALKLPDSAVPMGDFPVAKAVDIDFDDGESLQEKLDNGTLGGAIGNTVLGKETVLYDSQINATGTFTLTDNVNNYDFIIINHNMGGSDCKQSVVLTKNEISICTDTTHRFLCTYGDGNASFCVFGYFNGDKVIITDCTTEVITSIVGYKFGQITVANTITNPAVGKSYSTDEQLTGGTWIDDKPIYKKTVSCGQLPNNDGKDTPHGIANIDKVIDTYGIAIDGNDISVSLPFADAVSDGCISAYRNGAIIRITTGKDRSSFTESYVTIEYTKTTD